MDSTRDDASVDEQSPSTSKPEPGSKSKPESLPKSKPKKPRSESKSSDGGILSLLSDPIGSSSAGEVNTTSQHGSHVYDQHCDICTGKELISPPPPAPVTPLQESSPPRDSPETEPMDTGVR